MPKDSGSQRQDIQIETRRGQGTGAVFMARNRFAVLDKTHAVLQDSIMASDVETLSCFSNTSRSVPPLYF